jgi:hypothetical protein
MVDNNNGEEEQDCPTREETTQIFALLTKCAGVSHERDLAINDMKKAAQGYNLAIVNFKEIFQQTLDMMLRLFGAESKGTIPEGILVFGFVYFL